MILFKDFTASNASYKPVCPLPRLIKCVFDEGAVVAFLLSKAVQTQNVGILTEIFIYVLGIKIKLSLVMSKFGFIFES